MVTLIEGNNQLNISLVPSLPPVVYTCPYCGANFPSLYELNEHIAANHPTVSPPSAPYTFNSATLQPITFKTNGASFNQHKVNVTFAGAEADIVTIIGTLKSYWAYTHYLYCQNPFPDPERPWLEFGYFDYVIVVPNKSALPPLYGTAGQHVYNPGTYTLTSKSLYLKFVDSELGDGFRVSWNARYYPELVAIYGSGKIYPPPGAYPAYVACWRSQVVLQPMTENPGYYEFGFGLPGANAKGWILKDYSIGNAEIQGLVV